MSNLNVKALATAAFALEVAFAIASRALGLEPWFEDVGRVEVVL